MTNQPVTFEGWGILAWILVVGMPIVAAAAAAYLVRVYYGDRRRPRSWLLRLLAQAGVIAAIATAWLAFLGVRRLLGAPPLEYSIIGTTIAISLLALIPTGFAVVIFLRRRRYGGVPPPFDQARD